MKKIHITSIVGVGLYGLGFIWQIIELARNLITDNEEAMGWMIYALLGVVIAVMAAYIVLYVFLMFKKKFSSKTGNIIMIVTSLIIISWFVVSVVFFLSQIPMYLITTKTEMLKIWATAMLSPAFVMAVGAILITITAISSLIPSKKSE